MFHTSQWGTSHSSTTPPLDSIQIWAHLTGVPLDLRYDKGLSLVAGLVGEPKETDDFTKNLVSLTVSHVKVEVNLNLPLPKVVEFERESGEVVEVQVSYPWVPPTCSHCSELGHIARNCLKRSPPPQDTVNQKEKSTVNDPPPSASKSKRGKAKDKVYVEVQRGKARVAPVENKVPEAGRSSSEIAENSASVAGVSVPVQLAPCELATMEASGGSVPPSETSLAPAVSFQLPLASFSSPTAIPRRPLKRS